MTKITRVEVIDENGRSYVNWEDDNDVTLSYQDDGRTLKVFVNKVKPIPQEPEEVAENLKKAFREAVTQGLTQKVKELNKEVDSMKENPPEFLKFTLGPTLYNVIEDWWDDVFTNKETSLHELVDAIEGWLPKEQSAKGSQNAYVECTVDGFNDAITQIKNNLGLKASK